MNEFKPIYIRLSLEVTCTSLEAEQKQSETVFESFQTTNQDYCLILLLHVCQFTNKIQGRHITVLWKLLCYRSLKNINTENYIKVVGEQIQLLYISIVSFPLSLEWNTLQSKYAYMPMVKEMKQVSPIKYTPLFFFFLLLLCKSTWHCFFFLVGNTC